MLRNLYGAVTGTSVMVLQEFAWPDSSLHQAEIHWYEACGIGRKEFKIKYFIE
jgi:hypothetical protein